MTDLNNPGPNDIAEARDFLRRAGYAERTMTDAEAVEAMRNHLRDNIAAPPRRAGHGPINARTFFADHLTGGGTALPADPREHPTGGYLGDGGEPVLFQMLLALLRRHTTGGQPGRGWTDEGLAAQFRVPVEDVRRGQAVLEEVARDVRKPATPRKR